MARITCLQGMSVETAVSVPSSQGGEAIAAGLPGRVVWDEGGDAVVVEFGHEVPNGGFDTGNRRQVWVPRNYLRRTN